MMLSALQLPTLFLIFVRILAVFMTAPVFSSRAIPTAAKIGLAGLLAFIILPVETARVSGQAWPTAFLPFLLVIAQEVLIGALIGFVSNLVFLSVQMAASIMGLQIGFRAANLLDPFSTAPTSALEQFYTLIAVTLFLTVNGHHWFITSLAHTFDVAPPGTFILDGITIEQLLAFTGQAFVAAVRISLPVLGVLLLTDLGLGLLARAVPQIQVFFLGLPLKMALGILALALTLVVTLPVIKELLAGMAEKMLMVAAH